MHESPMLNSRFWKIWWSFASLEVWLVLGLTFNARGIRHPWQGLIKFVLWSHGAYKATHLLCCVNCLWSYYNKVIKSSSSHTPTHIHIQKPPSQSNIHNTSKMPFTARYVKMQTEHVETYTDFPVLATSARSFLPSSSHQSVFSSREDAEQISWSTSSSRSWVISQVSSTHCTSFPFWFFEWVD